MQRTAAASLNSGDLNQTRAARSRKRTNERVAQHNACVRQAISTYSVPTRATRRDVTRIVARELLLRAPAARPPARSSVRATVFGKPRARRGGRHLGIMRWFNVQFAEVDYFPAGRSPTS